MPRQAKVNTEPIQTWISKDLLKLLNAYMLKADRNKADAIRILLKKALELEGVLREVQCEHEMVPCDVLGNINNTNGMQYGICAKCGYRP